MNEAVTFNPELFLNATIDSALSTELLVVPEGEYSAVSAPITAESFQTFDIKKGDRAGQKAVRLDITWLINDESGALKEFLGRTPSVRQGIMLDVRLDGTLENGKGRNVTLGQVREALNQNMTGRPWNFSMLGGQVAKIKVKHNLYQGKTFAEVTAVTKM